MGRRWFQSSSRRSGSGWRDAESERERSAKAPVHLSREMLLAGGRKLFRKTSSTVTVSPSLTSLSAGPRRPRSRLHRRGGLPRVPARVRAQRKMPNWKTFEASAAAAAAAAGGAGMAQVGSGRGRGLVLVAAGVVCVTWTTTGEMVSSPPSPSRSSDSTSQVLPFQSSSSSSSSSSPSLMFVPFIVGGQVPPLHLVLAHFPIRSV